MQYILILLFIYFYSLFVSYKIFFLISCSRKINKKKDFEENILDNFSLYKIEIVFSKKK